MEPKNITEFEELVTPFVLPEQRAFVYALMRRLEIEQINPGTVQFDAADLKLGLELVKIVETLNDKV